MARTVGLHIRMICRVLERGPLSGREIAELTGIDREQISKCCSRAVGLGLATVQRGTRSRINPDVFTVVPGWLELADQRKTTRLQPVKPRKVAKATRWAGVTSVFQMGAVA